MQKYFYLMILSLLFFSCQKEVPKELMNSQKNQQMPNDSIHKNTQQSSDDKSTPTNDEKANQLMKDADDADAKFSQTKSEADKKTCIQKQMTAANYLMFEANISPKKKYRPALQRYRRVLEIDPNNKEAAENKKQIEDIYQQMGMPIPN